MTNMVIHPKCQKGLVHHGYTENIVSCTYLHLDSVEAYDQFNHKKRKKKADKICETNRTLIRYF